MRVRGGMSSREHRRARPSQETPRRRSMSPLQDRGTSPRALALLARPVGLDSISVSPVPLKEKPSFERSGKLDAEALTYKGVLLKYAEPPDAARPERRWRFHVFKGDEQIAVIPMSRKSLHRFGREKAVSDVLLEHPSCSKQHAVVQFRQVHLNEGYGQYTSIVRPYLLDLDSANGTILNGEKTEGSRYYELRSKDVVKFGFSTREYIFLAEDEVDN